MKLCLIDEIWYVLIEKRCDSYSINVVIVNWCYCKWIMIWVYLIVDWWWEINCCWWFCEIGEVELSVHVKDQNELFDIYMVVDWNFVIVGWIEPMRISVFMLWLC